MNIIKQFEEVFDLVGLHEEEADEHEVQEGEKVCEYCGGTGEVSRLEYVYPDEGSPLADIGTETCICRMGNNDYE